MTAPLLDTHVWVWWLVGDPQLPAKERTRLDELPRDQRPLVCDISLWEVALLVHVGRLRLDVSFEAWLAVATAPATVRILPTMPATVLEMNRLPRRFHQDPADRLIVATAKALGLPLSSHDGRLRRSGLVKLWA
jgi:PIN domain nuclease of toxin-antitoxin system